MKNRNIKEKKHRLPLLLYKGKVRITFTLCVEGKKTFFARKTTVNKFLEILREAKNKHDCKNWVYIFMPDHLHLIIEGNSEKSDLWRMMSLFKQKTGFWLSQNAIGIKWQKDFYDHIHRKDEDLKKHIIYLLNNPVRKGLVDNWQNYQKVAATFKLRKIAG